MFSRTSDFTLSVVCVQSLIFSVVFCGSCFVLILSVLYRFVILITLILSVFYMLVILITLILSVLYRLVILITLILSVLHRLVILITLILSRLNIYSIAKYYNHWIGHKLYCLSFIACDSNYPLISSNFSTTLSLMK